jgi:hypothetical protein
LTRPSPSQAQFQATASAEAKAAAAAEAKAKADAKAAAEAKAAAKKNPKTFAELLEAVQEGADIESRYYEYNDKDELALSLNAHNVQHLASLIEARPTAFVAPLGFTLRNFAIGDCLAPLIFSLRTAMNLTTIELSNLQIGDACMTALARAITADPSDPHHHALLNLKKLNVSKNCICDAGLEEFFAAANSPKPASEACLDSNGRLVRKGTRRYPLPNLSALNLRENSITSRGSAAMAAAFRDGALPSLSAPQFGGGMNGLYIDRPVLAAIFSSFEKRHGGLGLWADEKDVQRETASQQLAAQLQSAVIVEIPSNENGLFGWRVQCWNNQLFVSELSDNGPAKASGVLLFDQVLSFDGALLNASDEAMLFQPRAAHTAFRFAISRQNPVPKMALNKPTLAGAFAVVELMKNGRCIEFAGGHWGRTVVTLVDNGKSIRTDTEHAAGGPRIGEPDCDSRVEPLETWLPHLLEEGYVAKISGWLK